jgi:hypothetical protein
MMKYRFLGRLGIDYIWQSVDKPEELIHQHAWAFWGDCNISDTLFKELMITITSGMT